MSNVDAHATTVLVAVEPRLLREALCIALRARADLDIIDLVDLDPGDAVGAAIVTDGSPVAVRSPVILELPDQDHWNGFGSLRRGDVRESVPVPTLEAVAAVLHDAIGSRAEEEPTPIAPAPPRAVAYQPPPRRRLAKRRTAPTIVVASVLLTGGVAAAAGTGSLPDPAQDRVSGVLSHLGVDLPRGTTAHAGPPSTEDPPGGAAAPRPPGLAATSATVAALPTTGAGTTPDAADRGLCTAFLTARVASTAAADAPVFAALVTAHGGTAAVTAQYCTNLLGGTGNGAATTSPGSSTSAPSGPPADRGGGSSPSTGGGPPKHDGGSQPAKPDDGSQPAGTAGTKQDQATANGGNGDGQNGASPPSGTTSTVADTTTTTRPDPGGTPPSKTGATTPEHPSTPADTRRGGTSTTAP